MTALVRTCLLIAVLTAVPALAADSGQATPAARLTVAPVEIDGNVLFELRGATTLPAPRRAGRVRDRIVALAADPAVRVDELQVVMTADYAKIMAGDQAILSLVDADAQPFEVNLHVLADLYRTRIAQAIEEYRAARQPERLLRDALTALVATVATVLGVWLMVWLLRRADGGVERRFRRRIEALEAQSFELVRAEQIRGVLRNLLRGFRVAAVVVCTLLYAHFVLTLFPWTRGYAAPVLELVLNPVRTMGRAILANVPNLIFLALLFVLVRFAVRMLQLFFDAVGRGAITLAGFDREWAAPTFKIARVAVVAFGLVMAYPYIPGSQSAAFKGVSLFIGVVFSLGSSSAISNMIAGYTMTYRRAFKVGDRIQVGDAIGDVVETRLQVTHLRSLKNEEVVIPNSQMLNSAIVNFSSLAKERGLILHTTVGIGYETPWRQVEAMLLLAVERTPGLLKDPAPFVLQRRLGDFAIEYEVNAYCREAQAMMALYTALHRNILDVFNEYGVAIMTPAYRSDPEQPKLVPKEHWYAPPARRDAGGAP
jgi:small-conductance mechanosensitive channel